MSLASLLAINTDDITADFDRIAKELFNSYLIQVNENLYRLLEIEFYYHGGQHTDPHVYRHDLQKTSGHWFFHPVGLDITFGNDSSYGGILIRAIEKISPILSADKSRYVFGPWNTQQEILKAFHTPVLDGNIQFSLVPVAQTGQNIGTEQFFESTRIGLKPKAADDKNYHLSTYRYIIKPDLSYKDKTGIALVMYNDSEKNEQALDEIKERWAGNY